jgi:hypothetical protein
VTPAGAKRAVVMAVIVTGGLATLDAFGKSQLPSLRQTLGLVIAGAFLALGAEGAPEVAGPFALLVMAGSVVHYGPGVFAMLASASKTASATGGPVGIPAASLKGVALPSSSGSAATDATLAQVRALGGGAGAGGSAEAATAVAFAKAQIGKPYQWGATGPNSFDCSGLVVAAYHAAGLNLPRTTYQQLAAPFRSVAQAELAAGDLVFPDAGHVQIYDAGGRIIEAPHAGTTVTERPMWGFMTARRVAN